MHRPKNSVRAAHAWRTRIAAGALAIFAGAHALAAPPNDDCATPAPISGAGAWNLDDLSTATLSPFPIGGTTQDTWYCWTPTWSGPIGAGTASARLDLGSGSNLSAFVYMGCGCPTSLSLPIGTISPLTGSFTDFEVQCGQRYMVRVGAEGPLYPSNNRRSFSITKLQEAVDCPPVAPTSCPDCCGAKPSYDNQNWTTNFTGQVAVVTANTLGIGANAAEVAIINLAHPAPLPSPIMSAAWNASAGAPSPTSPFRYSDNAWTKQNLGSVFGVTLDDRGNIFVAHTSVYSEILFGGPCGGTGNIDTIATAIGTAPGSTSASFYKLASGTGAVTTFNLPGGSSTRLDPGLGNINFDCAYNQLFVSHFGDGRIYRVSSTGTILSAYDHAADRYDNSAAANALEAPAGQYSNFARLGERVWAVQRFKNRLFYSVWGQNGIDWCSPGWSGTSPNTIWSIGINASGDFIPGSRQMELQPPIHPDVALAPDIVQNNQFVADGTAFSSPVSDISFSTDCKMLLAERSMDDNGNTAGHRARALEYVSNGTSWIPSNYRNALGYQIGNVEAGAARTTGSNSAGGCDYDSSPTGSDGRGGRLWLTGDYLNHPFISSYTYGITGLDRSTAFGTNTLSSIIIDFNDVNSIDKTNEGDVEIPCIIGPCASVTPISTTIEVLNGALTGCYLYTFTITNNTSPPQPVQYMLIPSASVTPNVIPFTPPLAPGATSAPITVKICGQNPGTFSMPIILMNTQNNVCCDFDHDVPLPVIPCFQTPERPIVACSPVPGGGRSITINFQPMLYGVGHVFAQYEPQGGQTTTVNITNSYAPVSVPQYGIGTVTFNFTTNPVNPPQTKVICFRIFLHTPDLSQCCSQLVCFTLPPCQGGVGNGCDIDFNNDGVSPDTLDLDDLLSVFGGGPCSNDPFCDSIDFNQDGVTPDTADIDAFLAVFAGGPC